MATIADAAAKGIKFDLTKAYNVCKRAIEEKTLAPWSAATCGWIDLFYKEKGYIPALQPDEKETDPNVHSFEKRQSVAVTLGTAYDEWCLSRIAEMLNKDEEAAYYRCRSFNYSTFTTRKRAFSIQRIKMASGLAHLITAFLVVRVPVSIMEKIMVGCIVGMCRIILPTLLN